jgi:ABC-type cobalamin/Fe3+-siderophores transport system ATPase subunit
MERFDFISLKARNLKCIGDIPQGFESFKPFNVIVGRNNTGKTTLLDMLVYLKTALSGISYMLCSQAEQPFGRGLDFLLGHPRAENRTNFLAQQFTTPRPPLVGVTRSAPR